MGVAPKSPQTLLWGEPEECLRQLDVVRVGYRLGADPHSLATSRRKPLERLPGGRRRAPLVAGHGGLRRAGAVGESALGETSAKAQLAHKHVWGIHIQYDTSSGIKPWPVEKLSAVPEPSVAR